MNFLENIDGENPEVQKAIEFYERLEKMPPEQKIGMIFPKFNSLENEKKKEAIELFAGLFGIHMDFGAPLPEWAKAASEKFRQCLLGENFSQKMENENSAAGFFMEIINLVSPTDLKLDLIQAFQPFIVFKNRARFETKWQRFETLCVKIARFLKTEKMRRNF